MSLVFQSLTALWLPSLLLSFNSPAVLCRSGLTVCCPVSDQGLDSFRWLMEKLNEKLSLRPLWQNILSAAMEDIFQNISMREQLAWICPEVIMPYYKAEPNCILRLYQSSFAWFTVQNNPYLTRTVPWENTKVYSLSEINSFSISFSLPLVLGLAAPCKQRVWLAGGWGLCPHCQNCFFFLLLSFFYFDSNPRVEKGIIVNFWLIETTHTNLIACYLVNV